MTDMANDDMRLRQFADTIICRGLQLMQEEGVTFPVMMDRLLTAAAAHIAIHEGEAQAACVFRDMAKNIEAGALAQLGRNSSPRH